MTFAFIPKLNRNEYDTYNKTGIPYAKLELIEDYDEIREHAKAQWAEVELINDETGFHVIAFAIILDKLATEQFDRRRRERNNAAWEALKAAGLRDQNGLPITY